MLAAPATGPSSMPASTTASGCSVNGTGVPGIGIAICAASAIVAAKPITPTRGELAVARGDGGEARHDILSTLSATASPPPRQSVASPRVSVAILHRVQQRREHARAARADRMAERDRAAVHVHAIPVPSERRAIRERLRRERLVRFDEIVVADLRARLLHQILHGDESARRTDPAARRRRSRSR